MHTNSQSRAPQRIGKFGEGLVSYALIRQGFDVATVDDIGADLIADRADGLRMAVSVKTRLYRKRVGESWGFVVLDSDRLKLEKFAQRFRLKTTVFAHVACTEKTDTIHLFMFRASVVPVENLMTTARGGYYLNYSPGHLNDIKNSNLIDYSSWSSESIGKKLFGEAPPSI